MSEANIREGNPLLKLISTALLAVALHDIASRNDLFRAKRKQTRVVL